jgi:hypothetical protein
MANPKLQKQALLPSLQPVPDGSGGANHNTV